MIMEIRPASARPWNEAVMAHSVAGVIGRLEAQFIELAGLEEGEARLGLAAGAPFFFARGEGLTEVDGVGAVPPMLAGMVICVQALEYLLGGWRKPNGRVDFAGYAAARYAGLLKNHLIRVLMQNLDELDEEQRESIGAAVLSVAV